MSSVFVDPGSIPLDRPSLSGPPLKTPEGLAEQCRRWADDVGWSLAADPGDADVVVLGDGARAPAAAGEVLHVERPQGVDGFRWAIRSAAFRRRWPYETLPYGLIPDHVMDVRRTRGDRRGVVVLVHGGFWRQPWRRDLMDGLAVALVQRGWETWNVEYGRVGGAGGWPASGEDVVTAVGAVLSHAETDEVTLLGHSAGAQLALWAAGRLPEAVAQVVSLAGLCDLEQAKALRLGGGAVDHLLGDRPVADASPMALLPLGVPVLLAHCLDDEVVPVAQSVRYAEAARAAGDQVRLVTPAGGGHMSLIEPEGAWESLPEL